VRTRLRLTNDWNTAERRHLSAIKNARALCGLPSDEERDALNAEIERRRVCADDAIAALDSPGRNTVANC
jgi:hypothetical protein